MLMTNYQLKRVYSYCLDMYKYIDVSVEQPYLIGYNDNPLLHYFILKTISSILMHV